MRAVGRLSLWLWLLTSCVLATEEGGEWEENSRLPGHLLPLHYDLYLHPDLQEGTFKGLWKFFYFLGDVNLSLRSG